MKLLTRTCWMQTGSENFGICFVVCAAILTGYMFPIYWSGNEIHYFDLAYRMVRPDLFGDNSAVFDSSNTRFVSYWIIGTTIDFVGHECAKIIFGVLCLGLYAVAVSLLAGSLSLGPVVMAAVLVVFLSNQSLLGKEWIFGTTEAKVFAYICVLLAIPAALNGKWMTAVVLAALGTAFHFLVGGFWGLAIIILHAITTRSWRHSLRFFVVFALMISPIVSLIIGERIGSEIDLSRVDLDLPEIYAVFRNSHHVAPFANGISGFATDFLPGLVTHVGFALVFFLMRKDFGRLAPFALWVSLLNAYFVVAIAVSFFDRDTHLFAPLYVLRPSGLTLLLSMSLISYRIVKAIPADFVRWVSLLASVFIAGIALSNIALRMSELHEAGPVQRRLEALMDGDERKLLTWLQENTSQQSLVLVQPQTASGGFWEARPFPAALERLSPASYYVNWKFVPTAPADLAEWYRRLQERRALFKGDCALLDELSVDYLITQSPISVAKLDGCSQEVFKTERYVVLRAHSR